MPAQNQQSGDERVEVHRRRQGPGPVPRRSSGGPRSTGAATMPARARSCRPAHVHDTLPFPQICSAAWASFLRRTDAGLRQSGLDPQRRGCVRAGRDAGGSSSGRGACGRGRPTPATSRDRAGRWRGVSTGCVPPIRSGSRSAARPRPLPGEPLRPGRDDPTPRRAGPGPARCRNARRSSERRRPRRSPVRSSSMKTAIGAPCRVVRGRYPLMMPPRHTAESPAAGESTVRAPAASS